MPTYFSVHFFVFEFSGVLDCTGFRVGAPHRLEPSWNFDTYEVRIEILQGVTSVGCSLAVFGNANYSLIFSCHFVVCNEKFFAATIKAFIAPTKAASKQNILPFTCKKKLNVMKWQIYYKQLNLHNT